MDRHLCVTTPATEVRAPAELLVGTSIPPLEGPPAIPREVVIGKPATAATVEPATRIAVSKAIGLRVPVVRRVRQPPQWHQAVGGL